MRRRLVLAALAALLPVDAVLLPTPLLAQLSPAPLRVSSAGGTVAVGADTSRGYVAYPAAAIEALGGRVEPTATGARVLLFGDTLVFEAFSPFFRAGGAVVQLALPFYRHGAAVYWPRQLLAEWLPARYPARVTLADGGLRVAAGRAQATASGSGSATGKGPPGHERGDSLGRSPTAPPAKRDTRPPLVVVDAGHGGRDPGKIGPGGVREKEVTLAIAKRLASTLRERGYEVRMTRTTDTLIALADRPRFANQWKQGRPSALFISIHANSFRGRAQGYETYFLSDARTEDERRVAEMENAAVAYEEQGGNGSQDNVGAILNGLRNDFYVHASDDLAETVQSRLSRFEPGRNRGVKQAGFRVLVGAFMPAVLVETAFISDREEERLLATAAFQGRIADAVADAVDRFFETHEHLLVSTGRR